MFHQAAESMTRTKLIIFILGLLFSAFPSQFSYFFFFFPNRAALSGSIVTSRGLDVHGAALKLAVPGVHDTV